MEEWKPIRSFAGYSVSSMGRVRNDEAGRFMAITRNNRGIYQVGLTRDFVQYRRSVPLLVADAFLPPHANRAFTTPIQLDGDYANYTVENLLWRPRWFALMYRRQFNAPRPNWRGPIIELKTEVVYPNSWVIATTFGLLDKEIATAILGRTYVWPTFQEFRGTDIIAHD